MEFRGTVYFDYVCPYVNRFSRLLGRAEREGVEVAVDWRPFSLEQVNATDREVPYWEQPEDSRYGAIHALAAHEWVRATAPFAEAAFRRALLFLRHDEEADFTDWETFGAAAGMAGLEGEQLVAAVREEREGYAEVGASYEEARELGVFGVPTLVRPGLSPLFIKLTPPALEGEVGPYLELIDRVIEAPGLWELKRPH